MKKPKTIKIFLADGEPTGTKIVELSNWSGIAYLIPRNSLKNTLANPENKSDLDSQCVYFLIGESEEEGRSVYIGEAEEFSKRINQHNKNKDFWNLVIVFTSKDDNLTKAHVKYLESKVTQEIKTNNKVHIHNGNIPPMPKLPRSDIAEMHEFFEHMKILSSALGYTFLESINTDNDDDIFYCKGPSADARGIYGNEGFVILPGSIWRASITNSFSEKQAAIRTEMLNSEKMEQIDNDQYKLTAPVTVTSPSFASSMVLGRSSNGWRDWKNKEGKTLDELKRK